MLGRKARDVHVNVETELDAWPHATGILDFVLASGVPIEPCLIAIVSCHICEVDGHENVCEVICWELGAVQVTPSYEIE